MDNLRKDQKVLVFAIMFYVVVFIGYMWEGHILYEDDTMLVIAAVLLVLVGVYVEVYKRTIAKPIQIYIWVQKRYDYYDKLMGESYGDKYTAIVFENASKHFNIPLDKLDDVYWKGVLAFSARQQKKYEKREKKRLAKMEKKNKGKR